MTKTNNLPLQDAVRELQLREATEQEVLEEVVRTLEFARDYFERRGRVILKTNIECQLRYFESAQVYDRMDEQDIVPSTDAH
jgi:hypothetical protein